MPAARFLRAILPVVFLLSIAVIPVASPADTAGAATRAEAESYAAAIAPKHELLGEAVGLMGRIIVTTARTPFAIDTARFWDAVDRVEEIGAQLGDGRNPGGSPAAPQGEELGALHGLFLRSLASLREASALLEAANFEFSKPTEDAWDDSRRSFLSFAEGLAALKAKHGLAAAAPGGI